MSNYEEECESYYERMDMLHDQMIDDFLTVDSEEEALALIARYPQYAERYLTEDYQYLLEEVHHG